MPSIHCAGVRHVYPNNVVALNGVNLELGTGITGVVGLNGVGKSTLLGILLGALEPTAGSVLIDGMPPNVYRATHGVGYVAEGTRFEGHLRVVEFLDGLAELCSAPVYETFGTESLADRRLDQLSQGQRRRVEIAAALIGGVALLLLDEPTNGLDPIALRELREILLSLRRPGVSVIISSHHLDELERIVDRVVLMTRGAIDAVYTRDELLARYGSFDAFAARLSAGESA